MTSIRNQKLERARLDNDDAEWDTDTRSPSGDAADAVLAAWQRWEERWDTDSSAERERRAQRLTDARGRFGDLIGHDFHGEPDEAVVAAAEYVLGRRDFPFVPAAR